MGSFWVWGLEVWGLGSLKKLGFRCRRSGCEVSVSWGFRADRSFGENSGTLFWGLESKARFIVGLKLLGY